ncbi:MAG: right-handed parallel beta-helix repeat-containing protein [Deltaproteobacteria bacterium]|nr:MAG: right-handed parallel beta-helix repeat-containing protein [Deltaproteobacteria bacterium]
MTKLILVKPGRTILQQPKRRASGSSLTEIRANLKKQLRLFILWWTLVHLISVPAVAATYYVDPQNGNDSNIGTSTEMAWATLGKVNGTTLSPGDLVLLRRSRTWEEGLSTDSSGSDSSPVTIGAYGVGDAPVIRSLTVYGDYTVVEDLVIDAAKASQDAARVSGARNCVLRRLTIRNGTREGVDVSRAENLLIDACHIHHFLAGSFANQQDAHGIVVTRSQGITVRNTEIHHVSGDSFQADPARDANNLTNDILIEDCHFWTGPLTTDFNSGWVRTDNLPESQRQYPGENAIDTKVLKSGWETVPRMRITIRNVLAHGWKKDAFIANKAAFNLKEKIEAIIDGVTVFDSEIAFRLRGANGNANVTLKNGVVYSCEKALRAEDNLENLTVYNSTFGHSIATQLQFAGGSAGTSTWEFANNVFVETKPTVATDPTNLTIAGDELSINFANYASGDYDLRNGSLLIGTGKTLIDVTLDRNGRIRTPPYDIGAYEFSTDGGHGSPPLPPENLRIM